MVKFPRKKSLGLKNQRFGGKPPKMEVNIIGVYCTSNQQSKGVSFDLYQQKLIIYNFVCSHAVVGSIIDIDFFKFNINQIQLRITSL